MWKWAAIALVGGCATVAAYNIAEVISSADKYKACIAHYSPAECR